MKSISIIIVLAKAKTKHFKTESWNLCWRTRIREESQASELELPYVERRTPGEEWVSNHPFLSLPPGLPLYLRDQGSEEMTQCQILILIYFEMFLFFFIYLKGKEKGGKNERAFICEFSPQMPVPTGTHPSWIREPGIPSGSLLWVAGTQSV